MAVGKRDAGRALQKVLGQGANVNAGNPLEVHDPKVGSLISYEGTTTADGAGDGSSLEDSALATKADYDGHWVVITSGPYVGQCSDITGATTGGTVTAHTAFDGQILRGTKFVILAMKALPAEVAAIITSQGKMLFTMDFWSDPQEEIAVPAAAGTLVFTPTVTIADLPATATIVRAIAMFKFRMVENTYAGVNALDGPTVGDTSQVIQVKETAAGAYIDAINFADNQFTLASETREGGDVLIGSIDIVAQVDDNGSYTFQWKLRKADQDFINFNDCQVGLRIWYSV